jgi:polar amino acid transport system substrate-binding protein
MKKFYWLFPLLIISVFISGCGKQKKEITSLKEVKNVKIGVMTGTTGEQIALQRFTDCEVKRFDDVMDAISALKSGQIETVITGYPTALNIVKHNPDLIYLDEYVENEESAVAIPKGHEELLAEINKIIDGFEKDGTLNDLKRRWLKKDLTPYEIVDIPVAKGGPVFKVGTAATREPFSFVNEKKEVTGHDGELARRIAAKLNRPIEFLDMKFAALIPALKSGKIDVIISGMTATAERKKSIDFSRPYFQSAQVLLTKKAETAEAKTVKMKTLDDIKDKRVGVFTGTVHDAFVAKKFPKAEIKRYGSTADMLLSLKTDKIDVGFFDRISGQVLLKHNPDLAVLDNDALTMPLGIGFSKNNPQLREKFNAFLKQAKTNGVYDTIYKRWFVDNPEEAKIPKFVYPANGQKVILGVSVNDLPYVSYMNGEYVGFDVELVKTFAKTEGLNLEVVTMEFASLVAALSAGKVDMIADGIAISEERAKQVAFSDTYMDFMTSVIAPKSKLANFNETGAAKEGGSFFTSVANSFYSNLILEDRYLLIIDGLKVTMEISVLATIFGTLLGALICFMRMARRKLICAIGKVYISILRGTPVLVILMIIFYVIFASVNIDPVFVAVVAFGMNFAAYVSEMFRTGIEGVERGQTEAGIAMGFTKFKTFIYIVMPQAIKRILPVYKGELISLVKTTSIVGYIAVQDLTKASDIIRSRTFDAFFPLIMVAAVYYLLSWLLMVMIGYVERLSDNALRAKRRN